MGIVDAFCVAGEMETLDFRVNTYNNNHSPTLISLRLFKANVPKYL